MKNLKTNYKLCFGVLAVISILINLYMTITSGKSIITFLSFFTIQSNMLVAFYMLWSSYLDLKGKNSKYEDLVRGGVTIYISITGFVFFIMLKDIIDPQGIRFYTNIIEHYIIPSSMIVCSVVWGNSKTLKFNYIVYWCIYPFSYFVYTLIRGRFIRVYPYPFIDVSKLGYINALRNSFIVFIVFIIFSAVVILINQSKVNIFKTNLK